MMGLDAMGTFTHPITLHSASQGRSEVVEALVDTCSTFTVIPAAVLQDLRYDPSRVVRMRLADGRPHERRLGLVTAELDGTTDTIHCVFGEPDDPPIIGAHTLEGFLLAVDPVEERLAPSEALWM